MTSQRAGKPIEAAPVKFIAAILSSETADLDAGPLAALEELLGRVDFRGDPHPFTLTDYYEDEMGGGLARVFLSFEALRPATDLVRIKHAAAGIERNHQSDQGRMFNIDPGYIDFFKVVLASFKEGPQKIYLGDGVWADPVMMYQDGAFHDLPWTFPDFKSGIYNEELLAMRRLYRAARRS